jgi:RNA polymerase sigma-70 factor (ECF subfamily)
MSGSPPNVPDLPGDYDALDLLARRAAEGDESAFAALVERLQPDVFRWALPYATTRDDAEDLVQEAFVLAHRHLGSYRGPRALAAWLRKITRRAAVRSSKRRRRRAALTAQPAYWLEREVYTTDPGARVDRERLVAAVRLAWEELPPQQRAVLDLVDLQGHRPADAAREMGLRDVTLRANLFKARRFIRARVLHAMGQFGEAEVLP